MKTVKFIRDTDPEREGGPGYKVGDIKDFVDASATRWINRSAAVMYVEEPSAPTEPKGPTREELDKALASLPDDYTDPEFVVMSMRRHFGDLFTADDEKRVRTLVVVPAPVPPIEPPAQIQAPTPVSRAPMPPARKTTGR